MRVLRPTSGEWSRKRVIAEVDDEAKRPSEKVVIVGGEGPQVCNCNCNCKLDTKSSFETSEKSVIFRNAQGSPPALCIPPSDPNPGLQLPPIHLDIRRNPRS